MTLDHLIGDLRNFITEHPNLAKTDIAKSVGVTPSGLCHLLSGDAKPTVEQVLIVA